MIDGLSCFAPAALAISVADNVYGFPGQCGPPSPTPLLPTFLPAHWGLSVVSGGLLGYFHSLNLLSPSPLSSYCTFFFEGLGEGLWNEADIFLVNFFQNKTHHL